jgi:hypothetical protein
MTRCRVPDTTKNKMKTYPSKPTNSFSRCLASLLLGLSAIGASNAVAANYITGDIQFNGGATLNSSDLATASAFTSIFGPGGPSTLPQVLGGSTATGDYSGVPAGTLVTFQNFSFASSSAVTPLWTFTVGATTYSFDASTVLVAYQSSFFLDIYGSGTAHITGDLDTPGNWEVTDTGSGGSPVFTFGAATDVAPAPEPATSALLLMFLPIAWLAFRARRTSENRISNISTK